MLSSSNKGTYEQDRFSEKGVCVRLEQLQLLWLKEIYEVELLQVKCLLTDITSRI